MTQIVFKNTKNPAPLQNYVKNLKFVDMIQDSYLSVPAPAEGLFKDMKKRYHDARHHCYAYRLGYLGDRFRANDDGEPSGSAGRPILGQIDSRGLSDTLVVVVRYFGGIKLGIPGLIRAYKTSTSEALDKAGQIEKIAGKWFKVTFDYQDMNQVMKILKDMDLPQKDQDFGIGCSLRTWVRLSGESDLLERLSKVGSSVVEEIQ